MRLPGSSNLLPSFKDPACTILSITPIQFQVLNQLTPQTVMEIDGLLGNKPHPKK